MLLTTHDIINNADPGDWLMVTASKLDAHLLTEQGIQATTTEIAEKAWTGPEADLLKNLKVCVIPTNETASKKAAAKLRDEIRLTGNTAITLIPPGTPQNGGICAWIEEANGDIGKLIEVIDKKTESQPTKAIILPDSMPDTAAKIFAQKSKVTHHYNSIDGWSIYHNDRYQQVKDEKEIRLHIRKMLKKCAVKSKEGPKRLRQTKSFVSDVMEALAAQDAVHILPGNKAPSSFSKAINPKKTIALKNGLLDLSSPERPKVRPFTPEFYTFNYLPVEYDPKKDAEVWKTKMLSYYFTHEDDENTPDTLAQDVLHSWMKRWLLQIMYPHKICALIGPPRSGKSTIGRVMCSLLGPTNVCAVTIAALSGPHGLYSLMNKQLGIMWDAAITGRNSDMQRAVEVLKNISGQDNLAINPKNRDIIELSAMPLNILMIANKTADLRDSSGALATRFTFLKTTQDFIGKEDPSLEKYVIEHELPGILNLILNAQDPIIEHPASKDMTEDFIEMSSPYTAFANQQCDTGSDLFIPTDILWLYYQEWCEKYNHRTPSAQRFKVEFTAAIRGLKRFRPRLNEEDMEILYQEHKLDQKGGRSWTKTERPRCFRGIDVKPYLKGGWYSPAKSSYGP